MNKILIAKDGSDLEKETAKKELLALLKPTMTVYTVVRHVSSSGMTRHISCFVIVKNDYSGLWQPRNIDWYVEKIADYRRAKHRDGLVVSGCGMVGFSVVYNLSSCLFSKGFKCFGKTCRANDHANDPACDRVKGKHLHHDGGYALKQEWL